MDIEQFLLRLLICFKSPKPKMGFIVEVNIFFQHELLDGERFSRTGDAMRIALAFFWSPEVAKAIREPIIPEESISAFFFAKKCVCFFLSYRRW